MREKALSQEGKWILLGVPVLFLVGSLMHFLYDLSGQNVIVGLFAPVNESVWEHLKLVLLPMILWWTVSYIIFGKKYNININKWFTAALGSLLVALILIPMLFYFYTGAFGVELVVVDIIIFFLAVLCGQLFGYHIYKYSKGIDYMVVLIVFALLLLLFAVFTYFPPHIPMFMDTTTGKYGA